MKPWSPDSRKLKKYPHFDRWFSVEEASSLANDPLRVAKHPFFPFILFRQHWNKFAKKGTKGKSKDRPIRYAARGDAYIYSRYRELLSEPYESLLQNNHLSDSILAYRRIPAAAPETGGKCNIHFARDAFGITKQLGNCFVLCLDISSFFEHIDHSHLKKNWCRLLSKTKLPDDHFNVFKNITAYSVVDKIKLYERLGHIGPKTKTPRGTPIRGYLTPRNKMPMRLCDGAEFRRRIAGGDGSKSLLEKNYKQYGIPQGSPISDLLANIYLFDFDKTVRDQCTLRSGCYFRYSDDIFIVCPGAASEGLTLMRSIQDLIQKYGRKLEIKAEKSSVFVLTQNHNGTQTCELIHGTQGRNGIEYLGFRYDGRHVFVRDGTLSNLQRKVARAARYQATSLSLRYPDKSAIELQKYFDYESLIKRFGKIRDFGELSDDYNNWTFWSYAKKSAEIFNSRDSKIRAQLKNYRKNTIAQANRAMEGAVLRRENKKRKPAWIAGSIPGNESGIEYA